MNGENQTAAATDWDAAQYLRFEQERTQPSRDLAARIELKNPSSVLDIGCGPGNSTHVLRERFPAADILGVDSSSNMIEQARRQYPELAFDIVSLTPDCGEIGETYGCDFFQCLPAMDSRSQKAVSQSFLEAESRRCSGRPDPDDIGYAHFGDPRGNVRRFTVEG